MKPGAYLIKMARGGVVDEAALYHELVTDGKLRGAALDVHQAEGEGKVSSLAELPNVLLTPPIGSTTFQTEFLMEAHSGLSAKIVDETGFKGIWASGLAISATLGVRDNNEASWTQVLEVVEFMSDATSIPILVDADTGYGNFNNVRRLVRKLEQRDVSAMCIEDKLFPKTNSFIKGDQQPLADIDEFAGKIRAAKDAQSDPDFCVIARIEAFITGWGLSEVLKRAEAYHHAGADAILVHSKIDTPDEVLSFMDVWLDTCPVVIVPTMYHNTPTHVFEEADISLVIWANHLLRASLTAMQDIAARTHEDRSLRMVENEIASVQEIFRLQNAAELKQAEKRYLPVPDAEAPRNGSMACHHVEGHIGNRQDYNGNGAGKHNGNGRQPVLSP